MTDKEKIQILEKENDLLKKIIELQEVKKETYIPYQPYPTYPVYPMYPVSPFWPPLGSPYTYTGTNTGTGSTDTWIVTC